MIITKKNVETHDLPSEYTEVEYIESTGAQYIDTGFKPTNNSKIEIDFYSRINGATGTTTSAWQPLYATRKTKSSPYKRFGVFINYNTKMGSHLYGESDEQFVTITNDRHQITQDKDKLYLDGTLVHTSSSTPSTAFTSDYNLFLFGVNQETLDYRSFKGRIYSCKIYNNDTLVREYYPCYRNSDHKLGLYDTTNDVFYTNQGTGEFECGNEVGITKIKPRIKPQKKYVADGYLELDYIESTGTQYIDTNFVPTSETRTKMKIKTSSDITSNVNVFTSNWASTGYAMIILKGDSDAKFKWHNGTTSYTLTNVQTNSMYEIEAYKNQVTINGEQVLNATYSNLSYTNSIKLIGYSSTQYLAKYKIYSAKIWDNGILVRNMIPAMRANDSTIGLYDTVNDAFYTNAGTGVFLYGSSQPSEEIRRVYVGDSKVYGNKKTRYVGQISSLSVGRWRGGSAYTDDYLLCAGGTTGATNTTNVKNIVDVYDNKLIRSTTTSLSTAKSETAGGTTGYNGTYMIFAGGNTGSSTVNTVDAYKSNTLAKTSTSLNYYARLASCANTSANCVVAGGYYSSTLANVTQFNASLSRTALGSLSTSRYTLNGTNFNDYAVFFSGYDSNGNGNALVEYYNSAGAKNTASSLTVTVSIANGCANSQYMLIAGGGTGTWGAKPETNVVNVYNSNMVKQANQYLSNTRRCAFAGYIHNAFIFGGGDRDNEHYIDVFNDNLVRVKTIADYNTVNVYPFYGVVNDNFVYAGGGGNNTSIDNATAFSYKD